MMDIKEDLLLWFTNFLIKNIEVHFDANKSAFNNKKLTQELHKPIIRNFKKKTVYSGFKDNIWGADVADMQLISKFKKGFIFLL